MLDQFEIEILNTLRKKGKIAAIILVKSKFKGSLKESKEYVDDLIINNPTIAIAPNKKKSNVWQWVIGGFVLLLFANLVGHPDNNNLKNDVIQETAITHDQRIERLFNAWDGSNSIVENWIKEHINDPDSYKHISTTHVDNLSRIYVRTKFTATNAFGGRVSCFCFADIDTLGNLLDAHLK